MSVSAESDGTERPSPQTSSSPELGDTRHEGDNLESGRGTISSYDATSHSKAPAILIHDIPDDHSDTATASVAEEPDRALSTEDGSVSARDKSQISVADSLASSSSAVRSAQRKYLSPLRSKRYDGLRSALHSPSVASRPSYFNSHSRSTSMASIKQLADLTDECTPDDVLETIKWTKLRRISAQLYSESGKKAFGLPTCLTVAGVLAIGTSKGLILVYDYQQVCKHILGSGIHASQSGSVTALSLSADHTFLVAGHDDGTIYSWDLQRPLTPSKSISAVSALTSGSRGHIKGTRISSINFVGTRHSAFVSADDAGLVFYHTFSRKMFTNNVESIRLMGRYPGPDLPIKVKPNTVYSSVVLPLGNVPDFTDQIGLTAIITPYKLVLLSTTPVPRTQFRLNRPSGAMAVSSTISACAAWYPAMRGTDQSSTSEGALVTRPVLAFAWCRQLQFLEVNEELRVQDGESDPAAMAIVRTSINLTKEFVCEESMVALQWFSGSVLCLLTTSSRLLLLDVSALRVIGQSDVLPKQVIHHDIYRERLRSYFELREAEYVDQSFADAYISSIETYKGKTFLLGTHDLHVGSLLTWADKLLALISAGQHIEAIQLLVGYYQGSVELTGLRLPLPLEQRRAKLQPKIYETMLSAVRFSLAAEDLSIRSDAYHTRLIGTCLQACLLLNNPQFFVNEIYEEYEEVDRYEPFLDLLGASILDDQIQDVPPIVVQSLVRHFVQQGLHNRLEDVICHLAPTVLDINLILGLCRQHRLYNALTYVYTEALKDFTSPLFEFFRLIETILQNTQSLQAQSNDHDMQELGTFTVNAVKVYPFISMTLTGRIFPLARIREKLLADPARLELMEVLFSISSIEQRKNDLGSMISLVPGQSSFPYLRLLLLFDCPTFLACMDEAFEDPFLNESNEDQARRASRSTSITRQFIVNVLLEVMGTGFESEDVVYLYIFIARNVPKYPQFILLSGSVLQRIILGLCHYTDHELADDCQLSVEYLLSVYKPTDPAAMLEEYQSAGFYRVLKALYRQEENWSALLRAELRDEVSEQSVFNCVIELLGSDSRLNHKQRSAVQTVILEDIVAIASLNGSRAAETIETYAPQLQTSVVRALSTRDGLLYIYLKQVMNMPSAIEWVTSRIRERYIDLLCVYDRDHLLEYLQSLSQGQVDLSTVVDNLEQYNLIDAIVHLMSAQGNRAAALAKVVKEIISCGKVPMIDHTQSQGLHELVTAKRETFVKYAFIGVGLCEAETEAFDQTQPAAQNPTYESFWADLLEALISSYSVLAHGLREHPQIKSSIAAQVLLRCRNVVQRACSSLFTSTYNKSAISTTRVLRAWFKRFQGDDQDISLVTIMLDDVFDSYQYYFQLLALAQTVLGSQIFSDFATSTTSRNRGWMVASNSCCICDAPFEDIKRTFRRRQVSVSLSRKQRQAEKKLSIERHHGILAHTSGKRPLNAKTTNGTPSLSDGRNDQGHTEYESRGLKIISFACGHLCHEECYQRLHIRSHSDQVYCPACREDNVEALDPLDAVHQKGSEAAIDEQLIPVRY